MIYVTILEFFELFQKSWMQRILIAAILIGIVGGIIGTFIILYKIIFLGEAIAHSAFAGVALALVLGVQPLYMIFLFSELSAISVGYVNQKKIMNEDIILAIIFSGMMALGIIFINLLTEVSASVSSILFGAIFYINADQVNMLIIVSIIVIGIIIYLRKEYFFMVFNKEIAKISGIPVKFLDYLFLMLLAALIAVSIQAIGAILVFAIFIMPAAAAYMLTYNYRIMMLLSTIFGAISGFFGIMISFLYNLPGGPSIVIVATGIFIISFLLSPKRLSKLISKIRFKFSEKYKKVQEEFEHPLGIDVPHTHTEKEEILLRVKPKKFPSEHKWRGHRPINQREKKHEKNQEGENN
ncbi:MAG: iron chelate uptake ABC transporter family permease subunit [Candidatus Lokiarchaeota archaeon]|nr:iron chelate uptake ABC transporter family permease subunit [Candidatus Lokiarchaeota archaeon]MBD3198988.1 iron chelate uptake ABC transporter family permease subunit [Candidatus Lokiarchaeota archaeon]